LWLIHLRRADRFDLALTSEQLKTDHLESFVDEILSYHNRAAAGAFLSYCAHEAHHYHFVTYKLVIINSYVKNLKDQALRQKLVQKIHSMSKFLNEISKFVSFGTNLIGTHGAFGRPYFPPEKGASMDNVRALEALEHVDQFEAIFGQHVNIFAHGLP
jgi:hypothetical protein